MKQLCYLLFLNFVVLWCGNTDAQTDEFPKLSNSEADQTAQPMNATEAAESFVVPDNFHVDVFATEPQVQNPIAATWDSRGRLWIAENFTYAERSQRFDLSLRDRVLILEDSDSDGTADRRTVFTDNVQMLTSVEVGHGGVWLMCPPQLLFIPDADFDDKPDSEAVVVLDGFEVARENYHNFANGLRWGPDGWLYGRCGGSCPGRVGKPGTPDEQRVALEGGIWRYHPQLQHFEVVCHGTTNPWGHDWNEFADGFFINTVNGHLWQMIPGAHYRRPFTLDPNPYTYKLIDMHADHWHFDTGNSWTKSRNGAADSFGGGHAHSGMSIYLGDNWPDQFRGRLLTLNLHGRRINQEILNRHGSGYLASHGNDMMISADPFFRGLDLTYGPDGSVYVLDWSDTGECHEHSGVHRTSGRVYRVSYGTQNQNAVEPIDLRQMSTGELLKQAARPNEWYVRQARIILAERAASGKELTPEQTERLNQTVQQASPAQAIRALTLLHVANASNLDSKLGDALNHPNKHIRAMAISLLMDSSPLDDIHGPIHLNPDATSLQQSVAAKHLPSLMLVARDDGNAKVQLALASVLQRLPLSMRTQLATEIMNHKDLADDHNLPLMVWYGLMSLGEEHAMDLAKAAVQSRWPQTQEFIVRRLAEQTDTQPEAINFVLKEAVRQASEAQEAVLKGLSAGLQGRSEVKEPSEWKHFAAAVSSEKNQAMIADLSVLFGDGRALDQVRALVQDENADINLRRSALATLVRSDDSSVAEICLPLLSDPRINTVAAKGLAGSLNESAAEALIKNYRRFRGPNRPIVIEMLVSRPTFAKVLLQSVRDEKIPVEDLTAFDVRQIHSLGNEDLSTSVTELWGNVRNTPEAQREQIDRLKSQLTQGVLRLSSAPEGRAIFDRSCAKCHRMFGHGETIGPDLTGGNRTNIDYLLENIVSPGSVVSKDYKMTVVVMKSGQVFNGLATSTNKNTMQLQTQNELKTFSIKDIEETYQTNLSPMPDGLLDNLKQQQINDLFWYLMQPAQVNSSLN